MRKIVLLIFFTLTSTIYSEPIYKEMQIDGKTQSFWVNVYEWTYLYDNKGNLIYEKSHSETEKGSFDWEKQWRYDSENNKIYEKDSNGHGALYKYDKNKNIIYKKDLKYGEEHNYEYNDKNNLVLHKQGTSTTTYEYDKNNNITQIKTFSSNNKIREVTIWEYDENNNKIYQKESDDFEIWWKYDENNNLIYERNSDNGKTYKETWLEYDKNNNKIYAKSFSNLSETFVEVFYKYDENGNMISQMSPDSSMTIEREFDKDNYLIYEKIGIGLSWYFYEFYDDGKMKTKILYRTF